MNKSYTNSFSLAKSDNNVNTNNVVNYPNPQPYKMTQIQAINNKPETVDPLVFSNNVTKNPENSQANKNTYNWHSKSSQTPIFVDHNSRYPPSDYLKTFPMKLALNPLGKIRRNTIYNNNRVHYHDWENAEKIPRLRANIEICNII